MTVCEGRAKVGLMHIRPSTKRLLVEARKLLVASGLFRLARATAGRRHIVLAFHRVRPDGEALDSYDTCPSLPTGVFRCLLKWLKSQFEILPLEELVRSRNVSRPAAAVTFDDGWRDNFSLAYPVLRELNIPATVFVTTAKIGSSSPFWQQILGNLFRGATAEPASYHARGLRQALATGSDASFTPRTYRATVAKWKALPLAEVDRRLSQTGWSPSANSEHTRCFLSVDEIREMAREGISFGSHTVNHLILPVQPSDIRRRELAKSRQDLEAILGTSVTTIAYPNGDCSADVVRCAASVGYRIGCTTRHRRLAIRSAPLLIPRIEPEWDCPERGDTFDARSLEWLAKW